MSDQRATDDVTSAPAPGDGTTATSAGDAAWPARPDDDGPPPLREPPGRATHRYLVAGLVAALVLAACGTGVGIGYALYGTGATNGTGPAGTVTTGATSGTGVPATSGMAATVASQLVNIYTTLAYQTAGGAGTGMVVTASGRVITNNHVIAGATSIKAVDLGNGKTYTARVMGYDVGADVAVLQLEGASGLKTVHFAPTSARVGDTVVAIGNAGGKGTPTAASGVVTGLDRSITALSELSGTSEHLTGLIETDAPIQSGQSGGPLVNAGGRVLGMVTAGSSSFQVSQNDSRGYAVPATSFRSIATSIVQGRASATVHVGATAFLGVQLMSTQGGALVLQVVATSPAAAAGITPGDVIVGLAGQTVSSPDTVASVLAAAAPGTTVQVVLTDQTGQQRTVTAALVAGPPA